MTIPPGYEAALRARRRKEQGWDEPTRDRYRRHRWRSEGPHAEAKTRHGLRRMVRRGIEQVAPQVYLTAIVLNLKRLARAHGSRLFVRGERLVWRLLAAMSGCWPQEGQGPCPRAFRPSKGIVLAA